MHKRMSPHGDADHMAEAINLIKNYKVDKVIFNCGDYNNLEVNLINELNDRNIEYKSCIKELNIDKNIKTIEENDTVGIIICKQDNEYVIKYCFDERIIARKYELV